MQEKVDMLVEKDVEFDQFKAEIKSENEKMNSKVNDWTYTTIAFIVMASLLFIMAFGMTLYFFKTRTGKPSFLQTTYFNQI